jgi:hypothetical protein
VSAVARSPSNLVIPWEAALSACGATYRDNDQLHKYPQPVGLQLNVVVLIAKYKDACDDACSSLMGERATIVPFREIGPDDI